MGGRWWKGAQDPEVLTASLMTLRHYLYVRRRAAVWSINSYISFKANPAIRSRTRARINADQLSRGLVFPAGYDS